MKIIKNSINNELIKCCLDELERLKNIPVWQSSTVFWPDGIKNNINGSCIVTYTGDEIKEQLIEQIYPNIPNTECKITTSFYIWQPNSGISKHTDHGYSFAMTIYLNEYWDVDWGGNFLYYDKKIDWDKDDEKYLSDHKNWKVVVPELGTMVLNDDETLHLVTPVSALSPKLRYTIQIWGH